MALNLLGHFSPRSRRDRGLLPAGFDLLAL